VGGLPAFAWRPNRLHLLGNASVEMAVQTASDTSAASAIAAMTRRDCRLEAVIPAGIQIGTPGVLDGLPIVGAVAARYPLHLLHKGSNPLFRAPNRRQISF
jgi:hypothetical protein